MEGSATKGLESNDCDAAQSSSSIVSRIYVEGYDTSLSGYDFVISVKKHFDSCGEVLHVYIPGYCEGTTLNRFALIYLRGEGAEDKALKLNGSCMGGHKLVVQPYPFHAKHKSLDRFVVPTKKDDRAMSYLMYVDGYDTSLPVDYVESMLRKHFSECGRVLDIGVPKENGDLLFREAYVTVLGIDALEKALQLDGCVRKGLENVKVCGVANPSKDGDSSGDMPPVSSWPPEYEISVMAATAPEDPNLPMPPPSVFTERPPTLKNRYAREDPSLPKPWKGLVDCTTGFKYFWNTETNVTQYQRPPSQLRPVFSSSRSRPSPFSRSSSRPLRVRVRR